MGVKVSTLRHASRVAVDSIDPLRASVRTSRPVPAAALLCVYRRRNVAIVQALAASAQRLGMLVLLWALDETAPELAASTIGSGPGSRFGLLNELASRVPADRWLLVSDDDVEFGSYGMRALLAWAKAFKLDLCQPAHARSGSYYFHRITGRNLLCVGRETTFVEIGPVVVIAAHARPRFLPFPAEGMGWGVELDWYDLHQEGARLGIIDASPIRHLTPIGGDYDGAQEMTRLRDLLLAHGVCRWEELQVNQRRLYPWSRVHTIVRDAD